MSKYIVKNCELICNGECPNSATGFCEDCTNCLIKQVIEKCKNTQYLSTRNRQDLYAVKVFANEILQLFEIDEVDNENK